MRQLLLGVVAVHLFLSPCFADVIPSRRIERNTEAEQKVKARLQQLGVDAREADRQVSDLSPRDAAYFAQNPERIQYASGLYWYEWFLGLAFAAVLIIIVLTRVY